MKIWFISDTHNEHLGLQVPEVDLVIHCGDESTHGNVWMNEPSLIGTDEERTMVGSVFISAD